MDIIVENPDFIPINHCISGNISAWAIYGAPCHKDKNTCTFLTSRLPRFSQAEDEWLSKARIAIDDAARNELVVVSSIGALGFDYITWCAARKGLRIVIILPPRKTGNLKSVIESIITDLNLDPNNLTFIMPVVKSKLDKAGRLHLRDRILWDLADKIYPIVIRDGGYWSDLILRDSDRVDSRFIAKYPQNPVPEWKSLSENLEVRDWGDILIHWTRGSYGPWPGETQAQYFRALTQASSGNPRDGFHSLMRILSSGVLRGEGRMIRGGVPCISFTELNPVESLKLIRYRSALGRWNFEPYGLALPRKSLERMGCKPVIYGDKSLFDQLPDEDKPYYQYQGSMKRQDSNLTWREEKEWRLVGDLDLCDLYNVLLAITPTRKEAMKVRELDLCRVHSLERK